MFSLTEKLYRRLNAGRLDALTDGARERLARIPARVPVTVPIPVAKPVPASDNIKYSLKSDDRAWNTEDVMRGILNVLGSGQDKSFVEYLSGLIREKSMTDAQFYRAAQMDRRLFSKMMSDVHYRPSKDTVVASGLALGLTLEQAEDLLRRAGYCFSHSDKRDIVLEYFFREPGTSVLDANIVLDRLGMKPLGRQNVA